MNDKIKGNDDKVAVKKWRCTVCGYEYEGAEVPEDFVCPLCGAGAEFFEEVED